MSAKGQQPEILQLSTAELEQLLADLRGLLPPATYQLVESLLDALAKEQRLSDTERLILHQEQSKPVMDQLRRWMQEQFEQKKVEPNSGLGQAISCMLKHWEPLTRFLSVPGAPLDNNAERALKMTIRHRKTPFPTRHAPYIFLNQPCRPWGSGGFCFPVGPLYGRLWVMFPENLALRPRHEKTSTNRRKFLRQATGLAAGAAVLSGLPPKTGAAAGPKEPLLPTIKLGPHEVTRLIIGANPIYGYSHFNRLLSEHQQAWHTPERVIELLQHCETKGLNTWQNSYAERTLSDLDRYRSEGGRMHWLCLGKPDWDQNPQFIDDAAKRKPIGIAPHGSLADRLHRQKDLGTLTDLLKRIRNQGVLVGLSAHNPVLIEVAEEKGWDVDYYMCCLYNRTRPRNELVKLLGDDVPLGEVYLPGDPPRMFKAIRATRKPCLAYKVLAAGRKVESAREVYQSFQTAFENIKPTDALIVGMYQQFSDQVGENARIVRELCAPRA